MYENPYESPQTPPGPGHVRLPIVAAGGFQLAAIPFALLVFAIVNEITRRVLSPTGEESVLVSALAAIASICAFSVTVALFLMSASAILRDSTPKT